MVTGGWITQADRSRWQQRAAAELAAILAAHPDLPVLAWTVTASGGTLSGQVLARREPARAVRAMAAGPGTGRGHRDPVRDRDACLPARPRSPRRRHGQRRRDRLRRRGGQPVSVPGGPDDAEAGQYRAPAGLLEKLMAAVRPEFRAGVLTFDPRDPVFGGPPCAVPGCERPARDQEPVLGPPSALASGRQARPGPVHGVHQPGLGRAPAAVSLRGPRLRLLPLRARPVPAAPSAMGKGRPARHQRLADGPGLRSALAAGCLRGARLRPVGDAGHAVLPYPLPELAARQARARRVRGGPRRSRPRVRVDRRALPSRPAAAGDPVRAAMPRG